MWTAKTLISLGFHSDQTGRMPRLIWIFAGRTATLLVLSCRGSWSLCWQSACVHVWWFYVLSSSWQRRDVIFDYDTSWFVSLYVLFSIAGDHLLGTSCPMCLSAFTFCLVPWCLRSCVVWCLRCDVELDYTGSWALLFYFLLVNFMFESR